jgi:WD40 repeat protein
MSDLPGVGWSAVWRYDGPTFIGNVTVDAGALPEALRNILTAGGLTAGDTGGQDAGGLLVSPFPLADGRSQLGLRIVTPDATYGARLAFRVAGESVTDVSVLPWDENAVWPPTTAVPGPGGAAVSVGTRLTLLDQSGRATLTQELGSRLRTFVWSPSGRQAIATTEDDRLWRVDAVAGKAEPFNPGTPPDTALLIAWSPDETRLLLGKNWGARGGSPWDCPVWLYSLQDGALRRLGSHERLLHLYWQEPDYALIYLYEGGGHSGLERHRVDTWEMLSHVNGRGALSPNGKLLVVNPWEVAELTLVNVDTGAERTVWKDRPPGAPAGAYQLGPLAWASDSRRFAYRVDERSGAPGMLRVSNTNGNDVQVTDHPAGWMAWQPQPGGGLLYGETNGNDITVKLDQQFVGTIAGARELGAIAFTPDGKTAAVAATNAENAMWLSIVQTAPPSVKPVPNGKDLSPIMWLGDRLLVQEWPYFHHATSWGRAVKALWLIDPTTGERTLIR